MTLHHLGHTLVSGLTVLQAMIIAQAMQPRGFNSSVNYHSVYGAFVESIEDIP